MAIKTPCKGKRNHKKIGFMVANASVFNAICKLAGKTAINNAIKPQAAKVWVAGKSKSKPRSTSARPLM